MRIFSTKHPVPEESRQWVDRRMNWIVDQFGEKFIATARVVLPTPEFFPDPYDGRDQAAAVMFTRVCQYMGIPHQRVELRLVSERQKDRGGELFIKNEDATAAGTYHVAAEKQIITIERSNLREPMVVVATMAHELSHVHLLGDSRVSRNEEDHEPLTDLLTVCSGMGIFGANACVRYSAWSDGKMQGWSTSSLGYLRQETWAYALSRFAWMRREAKPASGKYLRPDVRSVFKKSLRLLHASKSG